MNPEYLKKAHERIKSVPVLVNLVSRRTKQLINGEKPLLRPLNSDELKVDTALREIGAGLIYAQVDFDAIKKAEDARTKWAKRTSLRTIYPD